MTFYNILLKLDFSYKLIYMAYLYSFTILHATFDRTSCR